MTTEAKKISKGEKREERTRKRGRGGEGRNGKRREKRRGGRGREDLLQDHDDDLLHVREERSEMSRHVQFPCALKNTDHLLAVNH
eukprot:765161-Hanusia_phi.AAC.3